MTLAFNDIRFAVRGLVRSPLFSIVAILSLALGIGANTAIFTLIDQILLRKLPVAAPDELVMLYQQGAHNGSNMGQRMHSYPIYQEYQKRAEPLAEVLCRRLTEASVSIDNQTERLDAEMVSGNFFSMLGVHAAVGRVFNSEEDDRAYQGHPVVVLSYDYWVRRFARDPSVVGKKIQVNNYPMTIVGVSAAGFAGIDPARSPQIRVPVQMKPVMAPAWGWVHMDDPRTRWVQVFARLKPGWTVKSAEAPLQGLFMQIRQNEMTLPGAKDWSAYAREQFMKGRMRVESAAMGYSRLRNDFSTAAARADVHGRPRPADRVRQCREPADRARLHAAEGDCGSAVARRVARPARAADAGREPGAVLRRRACWASPWRSRSPRGCSRSSRRTASRS